VQYSSTLSYLVSTGRQATPFLAIASSSCVLRLTIYLIGVHAGTQDARVNITSTTFRQICDNGSIREPLMAQGNRLSIFLPNSHSNFATDNEGPELFMCPLFFSSLTYKLTTALMIQLMRVYCIRSWQCTVSAHDSLLHSTLKTIFPYI
jgi:hypothetical protein